MIFAVLFWTLAVVCFLYYGIIVAYAGFNSTFSGVWVLAAAVFAILGAICFLSAKKTIYIPLIVKYIFEAVLAVCFIIFVVVEANVVKDMSAKSEKGMDYVIVLGAKVDGSRITKSLKYRILMAYEYAMTNENTVLILSGGQGENEDLSEAQAMYNYLAELGLPAERMIMEDKSTNTRENLQYSLQKIAKNEQMPEEELSSLKIGLVTNGFHMHRALLTGKGGGYEMYGISAKSDTILLASSMVREFFALVKYKIVGAI